VITAELREPDAAIVTGLVKGAEVLQVGCWQGHDTAALARSAARVVTVAQCPGLDHTGFRDQVSMWAVIQRFYSVADHTLILPGEVHALLGTFTPGQFDVAVIDFNALGHLAVGDLMTAITIAAKGVIIISDHYQQFTTWAPAMAKFGYTALQYGRVWVFEPAPAEDQDESKDQG